MEDACLGSQEAGSKIHHVLKGR